MFDIGFAELLLIGVVGLLVVGPERLLGAVRTVLAWVNRFRRSFDQIRTEVRRELHNDEILQKLKAESRELEQQILDTTQSVEKEIEALGSEASLSLNPTGVLGDNQSKMPSTPVNAKDTSANALEGDDSSPSRET